MFFLSYLLLILCFVFINQSTLIHIDSIYEYESLDLRKILRKKNLILEFAESPLNLIWNINTCDFYSLTNHLNNLTQFIYLFLKDLIVFFRILDCLFAAWHNIYICLSFYKIFVKYFFSQSIQKCSWSTGKVER